ALRRPLKKWAAVGALVAALLYTLLVDAPVTALRAFVMSAIMLGAVLADREPLSMRLVAWSAAALLLTAPEVLLGASFQLSFAAVVPLVAVYEVLRRRQALRPKPGIAGRGLIYLRDLVLASAVASAATTPIGAYHFNQGALYGLVANLLAVPLNGAWVMPWGLLAYLLMPFGLEALALVPMGWGLDATLWIAAKVAAWPQAEFLAPAAPAASLALFALGGLWLCLWQSRLRLFGLLPMALAFALGAAAPKPDILVNNDGQLVAVRGADGRLMLSDLRRDRLDAETWLRRNAQAKAERFPKDGETAGKWLRCDDQACLYRRGPWAVALVRRAEALAEDCRIADIVISAVPVRMPCPALLVVDPGSLRDTGALAIGLRGLDPTVETVAAARGRRPWTGRP
ncbi:MAG TPA: ComEC/Rec2 family competence protein, partial [Alphaproteobacteria bacterium]|nr:ComEC/Rec2 family competence protein [Alphaproteobacteria bacterium]